MGLLNLPSDGLPSVLIAFVHTLRQYGRMEEAELLALCRPQSLVSSTGPGADSKQAGQTLTRWKQLGFFVENEQRISLKPALGKLPDEPMAELQMLGTFLRRLLLLPENNRELNREEGELSADFSLAISWALAQDIFALPGGAYKEIAQYEEDQFMSVPYAFRNDTRWNGFKTWAPLLGFGWTDKSGLILDPTNVVRDELIHIFGRDSEMPILECVHRLAEIVPVLDRGEYRQKVETRLNRQAWRATEPHELSISLSTALKRLEDEGTIRLEARGDANKMTLLGRRHRYLEQVSHIVRERIGNA